MNSGLAILSDTNAWIETHLLTTPIGSAVTYYLARIGGQLILPEVVETELLTIARRHARDAQSQAAAALALIQRFYADGQVDLPDAAAVVSAVRNRLGMLQPYLHRVPLSVEHVRQALARVVQQRAPNSDKREQFRDSILWAIAVDMARERAVAVVTADDDFWDKTGSGRRAKHHIFEDVRAASGNLNIYADFSALLTAIKQDVPEPDHEEVAEDLFELVLPVVVDTAAGIQFTIGKALEKRIAAFPTQSQGEVAVSFEFRFAATRPATPTDPEVATTVIARGDCLFDIVRDLYRDIQLLSVEFLGTGSFVPQYFMYPKDKRAPAAG